VLHYEHKLKDSGCDLIIGVDEAGRGPLAGPVVAAAVVLTQESFNSRIDDSKKLSPNQRNAAFKEITHSCVFGIGIKNHKIIDRDNILVATRFAMEEAVLGLIKKIGRQKFRSPHVIVDGNMPINVSMPVTTIIGGDAKSKSIAAASIVAKVIRDRIMLVYDSVYPEYGFKVHKGYPTKSHKNSIRQFGLSLIHRRSFHSV
jgi:ribonuclease HII